VIDEEKAILTDTTVRDDDSEIVAMIKELLDTRIRCVRSLLFNMSSFVFSPSANNNGLQFQAQCSRRRWRCYLHGLRRRCCVSQNAGPHPRCTSSRRYVVTCVTRVRSSCRVRVIVVQVQLEHYKEASSVCLNTGSPKFRSRLPIEILLQT